MCAMFELEMAPPSRGRFGDGFNAASDCARVWLAVHVPVCVCVCVPERSNNNQITDPITIRIMLSFQIIELMGPVMAKKVWDGHGQLAAMACTELAIAMVNVMVLDTTQEDFQEETEKSFQSRPVGGSTHNDQANTIIRYIGISADIDQKWAPHIKRNLDAINSLFETPNVQLPIMQRTPDNLITLSGIPIGFGDNKSDEGAKDEMNPKNPVYGCRFFRYMSKAIVWQITNQNIKLQVNHLREASEAKKDDDELHNTTHGVEGKANFKVLAVNQWTSQLYDFTTHNKQYQAAVPSVSKTGNTQIYTTSQETTQHAHALAETRHRRMQFLTYKLTCIQPCPMSDNIDFSGEYTSQLLVRCGQSEDERQLQQALHNVEVGCSRSGVC